MKICGTHKFSIHHISEALKVMKVPHILYRAPLEKFRGLKLRVGKGYAKVVVVDGLSSLSGSIRSKNLFIVVSAPLAELVRTNIPQMEGDDVGEALRAARSLAPIELRISTPKIMDYVNTAVKPSFLMGVQTALYQIANPTLRKTVQSAVVQFFDTKLSLTALCKMLKENYRTEHLVALVASAEALALREAVLRFRKGEDLLNLELETKFMSFDLLYIVRSSDKANTLC